MLRKAIRLELSSGVTVHVTPMSPLTIMDFNERINAIHPPINPKDFDTPVPETERLYEGQMYPGTESKEYQRQAMERFYKVDALMTALMLEACVEIPLEDVNVLLELHGDYLERLKGRGAKLDGGAMDIVRHIAIQTDDDLTDVVNAARSRLPLEEGEIAGALRLFRPKVRQSRPGGNHQDTGAQSPSETGADTSERIAG